MKDKNFNAETQRAQRGVEQKRAFAEPNVSTSAILRVLCVLCVEMKSD
jgi:hypothetical protein